MTDKQLYPAKNRPPDGPSLGAVGAALRFFLNARNLREIPRILSEGSGPIVRLAIQIHNTSEIIRRLRQGRAVNFVNSFPRSGNTWMRCLLADLFLQSQGLETDTELPVHQDEIVPDIYCNWISGRQEMKHHPALYVKSHQTFDELEERFGGTTRSSDRRGATGEPPFRGCKFIYLYRSPEDALVSLFHHYSGASKHWKVKTAAGIDAFCIAHLGEWQNNIASYLAAAEDGASVLFVPYELLLLYPVEILSNVVRWLGLKHENAKVDRAVSNMEFKKLQAAEVRSLVKEDAQSTFASLKTDPFAYLRRAGKGSGRAELQAGLADAPDKANQFFFRRGCRGSGRAELQSATVTAIQESTDHLIEQANSRVMMQQTLHGAPASSKTGQIRMAAALQRRESRHLQPAQILK